MYCFLTCRECCGMYNNKYLVVRRFLEILVFEDHGVNQFLPEYLCLYCLLPVRLPFPRSSLLTRTKAVRVFRQRLVRLLSTLV